MKKRKYEKPKLSVKKLSTFFFACTKVGQCVTEVNKNATQTCNPT
jgi:hypothetical protein